ncbi:type 4a pilus biogenesis protein PilO [Dactylosporangium sp. AC04546]|uniref:type 4a pilus biogenesis protein PilO n=1 Tax=Dactylosporangium sp. AC04546 TaxID=2862460 RepID=UPI001EDDD3E4|nr:type 4a pilus biogenesis protein PilO [Dactylosporangium sp. AC04546]WVK82425.1 type 4a pilus biogenesis protein PilO [Dactylosporangium sp. AC04546]
MLRADRLWLIGGAVLAAAILAVSYFFVISTRYQDRDDFRTSAEQVSQQVTVQRNRLAQMRRDNARLTEFTATLDANKAALPESDSVSALLRELQTAGELTGVSVSGVSVGTAVDVTTAKGNVQSLPVGLTVVGPAAKIGPFLDQLQKVQPRAVLITSVNVATGGGDKTNVTINLQAFYAVPE